MYVCDLVLSYHLFSYFHILLLFLHFVPILCNRHEKISSLEVQLEEEQERVNNGDLCVL